VAMGRIGSVALSRGLSVRGLDTTHCCVDPSSRVVGLSFRVYPETSGRTLLVESPLCGLGLANRPLRSSRPLLARMCETPSHPLMDLGSTPKYDPRRTTAETATPREVFPPLTLEATGSDQHRACLTRLCSACRFSQPLDALLLPKPFRLCFAPVTPVGFVPSEVFPPTRPTGPFGLPSLPDVAVGRFG
jgi:hypothetical protein